MTLFKIMGKDYTNKIIQGSFDVNSEDVYSTWTDANNIKHREIYRQRISGSFDMYFSDEESYNEFIADVTAAKTQAGYCYVGIMTNNENVFHEMVELFVDFSPKRQQRVLGKGYFPDVNVKVEGR